MSRIDPLWKQFSIIASGPMTYSPYLTGIIASALFAMALLGSSACSDCRSSTPEATPWLFESQSASYEILFPPHWTAERPGELNPHADAAASVDDSLFFMVIPQELPTFPRPDVRQLKRSGLALLEATVDDLVVERQGPIELDGISGLTVIARGQLEDRQIRYINSYLIDGDMGYQIIAFAHMEQEEVLMTEIDAVLSQWRFTGDEPPEFPESGHEPATSD